MENHMVEYWYKKHGDLSNLSEKEMEELKVNDPLLYKLYTNMVEARELFEAVLESRQ